MRRTSHRPIGPLVDLQNRPSWAERGFTSDGIGQQVCGKGFRAFWPVPAASGESIWLMFSQPFLSLTMIEDSSEDLTPSVKSRSCCAALSSQHRASIH